MISPVEHYTLLPGKLLAGEYPGHTDPDVALERLQSLASEGVRTFIDLTSEVDPLEPYVGLLERLPGEMRYVRVQIPDRDVPSSPEVMRSILDRIACELEEGRGVYYHCWGGIGRTGTVTGCWLRERGLNGDEALGKLQRFYQQMPKSAYWSMRTSPQTPAQFDYIRNWKRD
jgi:protein-tyrosine phosphatase